MRHSLLALAFAAAAAAGAEPGAPDPSLATDASDDAPATPDHAIDRLQLARSLPEATEETHGDLPIRMSVAAPGCIERFMDADDRTMRIAIDDAGTLFKVNDIDPEPEEA